MVQKVIAFVLLALATLACQTELAKKLPIIGERYFDEITQDTVFHTIPHFHLVDQQNENFCSDTLAGKVYLADFFFTHCPSMCPKMTSALKRVQGEFSAEELNIISISIDPKNDTVEQLTRYVEKNHIDTKNWYLLRGEQHELDPIGYEGFFTSFGEDDKAPGGYFHSSNIYLIDSKGRMRGLYDGMDDESVKQLTQDVKILLSNE